MEKRKPIGHVVATVTLPLYDGDHLDRSSWNDFIYEEPGIKDGQLAVCRRDCKTISFSVELEK